jgi:hypothetical protein
MPAPPEPRPQIDLPAIYRSAAALIASDNCRLMFCCEVIDGVALLRDYSAAERERVRLAFAQLFTDSLSPLWPADWLRPWFGPPTRANQERRLIALLLAAEVYEEEARS